MEQAPLITIGIPVYNCKRFIVDAIKSVLNQSYNNFELIITDDGSTDNTVEEIKKFKDPRIKLIVDGINRGISYRLNQQIEMAKGEFFVRMDGDDLMFPDRVEKQINYLLEHPEIDVVGSSAVIIDDKNNILGIRERVKKVISINDLFLSTRFMHPTVVGRTQWFKKWKYREEFSGCEDFDLWIRSFNNSCFEEIKEPLMFYRDPLKFKLKTYIIRKFRIIQCDWKLRKYMKGYRIFFYCILKVILTSIIACVLYIMGKDNFVIERRNRKIKDEDLYKKILCSILC